MKRRDAEGGFNAAREDGRLMPDADKMLILRSSCQSGCFPYKKKKRQWPSIFFFPPLI